MKDLYTLHTNPEVLLWHEYEDLLPWNILEATKGGVEPSEQQKQILFKSPEYAYLYSLRADKRWPEAEPYIIREGIWAFWYAMDILEDRWLEAEARILDFCLRNEEPYMLIQYASKCVRGRWPEGEEVLFEIGGFDSIGRYGDHFNLRVEETESGDLVFVEKWTVTPSD